MSALDRSPGEAIMAGFSLVAADNPALGNSLRAAARRAADEFVSSVEVAPPRSRERQYLNELLMAAVSFAAGLTRRQQERNQRVSAAEQERKLNFRRIVESQRLGGILRGGIQILLLGGFSYALVHAIFSTRWLNTEDVNRLHRDYSALATALASSLIGSFIKAWYTGWRINKVDRRYKEALREAKEIYHNEAVQEYEFAAQEANLAWQKFTGKPPAITDAFRVLIVGLLAGEREVDDARAGRQVRDATSASVAGQRTRSSSINRTTPGTNADIGSDGPADGALPADFTSTAAIPPEARPQTPGAA